ncbi:unnamed protein product [Mesocestoides corti]|uniref:Trafficking protein particle complex subunit n=1 Tax=Mesocestoides corti TaxID=53468 RepID=A0A3P6HYC9_MESCO|nr:unnamed protein product [Mesocestoides corti]
MSFHFRVYGSLDIIEDKLMVGSSKPSFNDKDATNKYLGLLYTIEDYCIYGYVTNTNVKFVVVQEDPGTLADLPKGGAAVPPDSKVKKTLESLHDAYLSLLSSPFYTPNTPIDPSESPAAKKFEEVVDTLLEYPSQITTSNL